MPVLRALVKPEILAWARSTSGYGVEEAARKISAKPERLMAWERGQSQPTINQLRRMAQLYKHPLSVFYLPEVPKDFPAMHDFRRLPGEVAGHFSPALRQEIRILQQRRELALELLSEVGEQASRFALTTTLDDDSEAVGEKVRRILDVTYEDQISWRDPRQAFKAWRNKLEHAGALVFQISGINLGEVRGFSVAESLLPVIVVNAKDAPNGRTFTLLHELAHVGLRASGLCDLDEEQPRASEEQKVEVFCNRVASAALMPRERMLQEDIVSARNGRAVEWTDQELEELSKRYCVSREAILRRLVTLGRADPRFYEEKRKRFLKEYEARIRVEKGKGGPSPWRKVISERGERFIRLVLETYHQDRITLSDVSFFLGVRVKHLPKIEQFVAST